MESTLHAKGHSASIVRRYFFVVALVARGSAQDSEELEKQLARDNAFAALRDRPVRVTFGQPVDPYLSQNQKGEWTGALKQLLDHLQAEVGFVPVVQEISDDSLSAADDDLNTACTRDIHLNRTDLCVADMWVTKERVGYAKVLPTLWQEKLQLGVARRDDSFRDALFSAFVPFSAALWVAIILTIVAYSLFAWYVEVGENSRDYPDPDFFSSVSTGFYHGLFNFFWSEPATRPVTAEGKIMLVGFGFFTLIMLCTYTASLASVLVTQDSGALVKSFESAIVQRKRICMWHSILRRAKRLYPILPKLYVDMGSTYADGYAKMESGECDAILIDSVFHAVAQSRSSRECNKLLVGNAILSINCAWFAADWLASPMSFFVTDATAEGIVDNLRQGSTPSTGCDDVELEDNGLRAWDMSGVFFIIIAFALAAIVVHCCRRAANESIKRSPTLQRWSDMATRISQSPRKASNVEGSKLAPTRGSMGSVNSFVLENNPGMRFVLNYRNERMLRKNPFERALVVAGAMQAQSFAMAMGEVQSAKKEIKAAAYLEDRTSSRGSTRADRVAERAHGVLPA